MFVPTVVSHDSALIATELARSLSSVSLWSLLSHRGGIRVQERLVRTARGSWDREYVIRFIFEDLKIIKRVFGISFSELELCISNVLLSKLMILITIEQRRFKSSGVSKGTALAKFTSTVREHTYGELGKGGKSSDDVDNEQEDGHAADEDGGTADERFIKKGKKGEIRALQEEEDSEEEEENDDGAEEAAKDLTGKSSRRELDYEDEDDDEEEGREVDVGANMDSSALLELDDDDDGSEENVWGQERSSLEKAAVSTVAAVATKHKTPQARRESLLKNAENSRSLKLDKESNTIETTLYIPSSTRRLLMVQLVEQAAKRSTVRSTKGIKNAYAIQSTIDGVERWGVQTEGVNLEAIWAMPGLEEKVDYNNIQCNHIHKILETLGVEAARLSIVKEIVGVFSVYGIDVNYRHLSLIADSMTRHGSYIAMNRTGMRMSSSPFVQMSFETTCGFLTKAAQEGAKDNVNSPSARIVLGNAPKVGTGCFDIMIPLTGSTSLRSTSTLT